METQAIDRAIQFTGEHAIDTLFRVSEVEASRLSPQDVREAVLSHIYIFGYVKTQHQDWTHDQIAAFYIRKRAAKYVHNYNL